MLQFMGWQSVGFDLATEQQQNPNKDLTNLCVLSRIQLFATLWSVARQASLSVGLSRQESWSRFPFPSPAELPDPGIKPVLFPGAPALSNLESPPKACNKID